MSSAIDKHKMTLVLATSGTTVASAQMPTQISGWLKTLHMTMPTLSAATVSGTVSLTDADGSQFWATGTGFCSSGMSTALSGQEAPIVGADTWVRLTLGGIPGSAAGVSAAPLSATINLYLVP